MKGVNYKTTMRNTVEQMVKESNGVHSEPAQERERAILFTHIGLFDL